MFWNLVLCVLGALWFKQFLDLGDLLHMAAPWKDDRFKKDSRMQQMKSRHKELQRRTRLEGRTFSTGLLN